MALEVHDDSLPAEEYLDDGTRFAHLWSALYREVCNTECYVVSLNQWSIISQIQELLSTDFGAAPIEDGTAVYIREKVHAIKGDIKKNEEYVFDRLKNAFSAHQMVFQEEYEKASDKDAFLKASPVASITALFLESLLEKKAWKEVESCFLNKKERMEIIPPGFYRCIVRAASTCSDFFIAQLYQQNAEVLARSITSSYELLCILKKIPNHQHEFLGAYPFLLNIPVNGTQEGLLRMEFPHFDSYFSKYPQTIAEAHSGEGLRPAGYREFIFFREG